jgi:hypothetical protein
MFGIVSRKSASGDTGYTKPEINAFLDQIDESLVVVAPTAQPVMTANTLPAATGVILTASSEYSADLGAWRVMDGDDSPGAIWASNGVAPHWIEIDFGEIKQGRAIEIQRRKLSAQAPNQFRVLIAKVKPVWRQIANETNLAYSDDPVIYTLRFKPYFRYIRIENMAMSADLTAGIVSLQSIKVLND